MNSIADAWDAGYRLAETLGWKLALVISAVPILIFIRRVHGRRWI